LALCPSTSEINMTQPTKLELQQRLDVALRDGEAYRIRIAELEGDVAALKGQLAKVPAPRTAKPAYVPPPVPEYVLQRRAAMTAAREAAMSGGVSVRVSL
jgi:hypothetical protein